MRRSDERESEIVLRRGRDHPGHHPSRSARVIVQQADMSFTVQENAAQPAAPVEADVRRDEKCEVLWACIVDDENGQ